MSFSFFFFLGGGGGGGEIQKLQKIETTADILRNTCMPKREGGKKVNRSVIEKLCDSYLQKCDLIGSAPLGRAVTPKFEETNSFQLNEN